jgi:hypothetical protein
MYAPISSRNSKSTIKNPTSTLKSMMVCIR